MRVLFYANARDYTSGEKTCEVPKTRNISELIDILGKRFGEKFKEYLLADNTCFFLVNGKGIMNTGGLNTPLKDDDKIDILPLVGGG